MDRMLKLNLRPITGLSKHVMNQHLQSKGNSRVGMIQVSSYSGIRWYATAGLYGGTKIYDKVLGEMLNKSPASDLKSGLKKGSIDNLILMPGLVSTAMTGYISNSYNTCLPDETAAGSLRDLGRRLYTHGSVIHTLWGV